MSIVRQSGYNAWNSLKCSEFWQTETPVETKYIFLFAPFSFFNPFFAHSCLCLYEKTLKCSEKKQQKKKQKKNMSPNQDSIRTHTIVLTFSINLESVGTLIGNVFSAIWTFSVNNGGGGQLTWSLQRAPSNSWCCTPSANIYEKITSRKE